MACKCSFIVLSSALINAFHSLFLVLLLLLLFNNLNKFFLVSQFLCFDFELPGQWFFFSFFSKAITHLFSRVTAWISPSKCFTVPTAPNRTMVVDKYILFIAAFHSRLLMWVQGCIEFKVVLFFIYDQLRCLKLSWSRIVLLWHLVHTWWLVKVRFLLHALVNLLCQCWQSDWTYLCIVFFVLFRSEVYLVFQGRFLSVYVCIVQVLFAFHRSWFWVEVGTIEIQIQ